MSDGSSQDDHTPGDKGDPDQRDDPKADDGGDHVVTSESNDPFRYSFPRRAVRSVSGSPYRVDQPERGVPAECRWPLDVWIEAPTQHFALRHVAVDVRD